jgi:hypothetical protein
METHRVVEKKKKKGGSLPHAHAGLQAPSDK